MHCSTLLTFISNVEPLSLTVLGRPTLDRLFDGLVPQEIRCHFYPLERR